jgi:hypothetical protein
MAQVRAAYRWKSRISTAYPTIHGYALKLSTESSLCHDARTYSIPRYW